MFIEVKAVGKSGEFKVLVAVDHISNIIEGEKGYCQIYLKNQDVLPVHSSYDKIKEKLNLCGEIYNCNGLG